MIEAAKKWHEGKFMIAGPQYPEDIIWPENMERTDHLTPSEHCTFYNEQRFTLNVTRREMRKWGYSPSVRLFEAAACGTPVISDYWDGLEQLFDLKYDILISKNSDDTIRFLKEISEKERKMIGENAMKKVLSAHSGEYRAKELIQYVLERKKKKTRTKKTIL
jgi:spore maturation protein CgeB